MEQRETDKKERGEKGGESKKEFRLGIIEGSEWESRTSLFALNEKDLGLEKSMIWRESEGEEDYSIFPSIYIQ